MATRSPRRSGGRSQRPKVSVLSQTGPSRRAGVDASSPVTAAPSEVSATTGCSAPYSIGRMSSVIPASTTTIRPVSPRSRTWSTVATIHPARATRKRPGSTASRAGRRSAGTASSRPGSSAANRAGVGTVPGSPTGRPPPTSSVSNPGLPARSSASTASPRRTASRQASTAPSWEPTWRCTPRAATGPSRSSDATAFVSSVSVMPNLDDPRPTASPLCVSGCTSGLRRSRTSSAGRPRLPRTPSLARAAIATRASSSSALSTATQRSGLPATQARTAARRSAADLPTPSRVMRSFASPAARATAHSPEETTFASSLSAARRATTDGTSFALSENARSQGSGKAASSSRAASRQYGGGREVDGRAESLGRADERLPGSRRVRHRDQSRTTSPTTVVITASTIDATTAPRMVSDVMPDVGQPPMVRSSFAKFCAR